MPSVRMIRLLSVLMVLGLFTTACGQKAGVHLAGATGTGTGTAGAPVGDGVFTDADGDGLDDDTNLSQADLAATTGTTGTGTTTGTTTPGAGTGTGTGTGSTGTGAGTPGSSGGTTTSPGQTTTTPGTSGGGTQNNNNNNTGGGGGKKTTPGQQPQQPTGPGDSTGVTANEIRIGLHAPLSGAAPLPQASFNSGKEQYWSQNKVQGRSVKVFVKNDEYNPSRAATVCKELIEKDKVFILIGGGGADQIAACARTAAQYGVPYLSAGVDEGLLRQLPNYFALSQSYPQQVSLIMAYTKKHAAPTNRKFAILRDRTPSFNNVVTEMEKQARAAGYEVLVRQIQNGPSDAQWLTTNQIQTAFPMMAPNAFVQIVGSPGGSSPRWVGAGITMGLNAVASAACKSSSGNYKAMFLSPFPGLEAMGQLDPNFASAGGNDDIELALWGLNKTIHQAFKKMGGNLTREAFVQAMTGTIRSGVYPDLNHTQQDHFRATSMHALVPDCGRGNGEYKTFKAFAKGF